MDQIIDLPLKKITDLTEEKWRTVYYLDEYGNRVRDREEYIVPRQVRTILPGPRFGHFILDYLVYLSILYIFEYIINMLLASSSTYLNLTIALGYNIVGIFLYPVYYTIFEYYFQRTPGKFLTKTLVIDEYGNKPGLKNIMLRSVCRLVPFEFVSCYGDKYSYGWHDRWSETWVVTEKELEELRRLQAEQLN